MQSKNKLQAIRKANNLTVEDVCKSCFISTSSYRKYELGIRIPRDDVKIRLAKYFGVSVGSLFFGE